MGVGDEHSKTTQETPDLVIILGPEMQEREQLKLLKSSEKRVKYPFAFT